jgi:hypothetical protein
LLNGTAVTDHSNVGFSFREANNPPKYDFNWQTVYEYRQPKTIPAGSKLVTASLND